jgi:NADPH:quinone reductase-like Zn-dependent oxidoreductase
MGYGSPCSNVHGKRRLKLSLLALVYVCGTKHPPELAALLGVNSERWMEQASAALRELIEAGKVRPVIDRRYTLSEVPEAIRYLEQGHARGKVVITLESGNRT